MPTKRLCLFFACAACGYGAASFVWTGRMADLRTVEDLRRALENVDPTKRRVALVAASRMATEIIRVLETAVRNDADQTTRAYAARLLKNLRAMMPQGIPQAFSHTPPGKPEKNTPVKVRYDNPAQPNGEIQVEWVANDGSAGVLLIDVLWGVGEVEYTWNNDEVVLSHPTSADYAIVFG